MKIVSVVGARPQFVKLAAVADALGRTTHQHVIVHTGQHYDAEMSDVFFADLEIPRPDVNLGIGSGSHGVQTGAMLAGLDGLLDEHRPDWVLVYGDTNSTLAGALSAVKMHLPLAHLEAGLRSFNRRMPEEHNRILTDHAADLCLAPTARAMAHLEAEGLAGRSQLVGDVMTDILLRVREAVSGRTEKLPPPAGQGQFYLATVHRAENTDDPDRLRRIVGALAGLPYPVALVAHPRLVARASAAGVVLERGAVRLLRPLPYPDLVALMDASAGVITDSGGLQKEAFLLRRPCTTLRNETEWTETVDLGWNVLAGDLAELESVVDRDPPPATEATPYGDGKAAERVVRALDEGIGAETSATPGGQ